MSGWGVSTYFREEVSTEELYHRERGQYIWKDVAEEDGDLQIGVKAGNIYLSKDTKYPISSFVNFLPP